MAKKKPADVELLAARIHLQDAILKDGEGDKIGDRPTFFEEFGDRLWEPTADVNFWWHKKAFTFSMHATEPQVVAYYRNGEIVVTHNGWERHKLNVRGWF